MTQKEKKEEQRGEENRLHDLIFYIIIERLRITFTANGRSDHLTIFTLYLPLAVSVSQ